MRLREELRALVDGLVAERGAEHRAERGGEPGPGRVSLDDLAERLGARVVSYEEIDAVIGELERRGLVVGDEGVPAASTSLPEVLTSARRLRGELGRTPTVAEIAHASGLPTDAIRRALWAAAILGR